MTKSLSRRAWLQRSAMAAAVLPVSRWYQPTSFEDFTTLTGDQPIRLNSNENPYGPGDLARKAVLDALSESNRYPWDKINQLKKSIAAREGVTPEHVMITAGSTELLGLAGLVYGVDKGELVSSHPTFDFLMLYAERLGCHWPRTPLDENMQQDLDAMAAATNANTKMIFICNPNNPTGIEVPNIKLQVFCEVFSKKYPIYLDEAYIELSALGRKASMVHMVDKNPNIIIGRTFSKVHGLAGLRIGYAIAHPDTIQKMSNLHIGRNMSISNVSCAAAIATLEDEAFETMSRNKIIEGRNLVNSAFDHWGVEYLPSSTNFIFFKNDRFAADPVAALKEENILMRNYPGVPGWSRVSIGKTEEMEMCLAALKKQLIS